MGIGRLKKSVLGNIKWSSWEYCSFSKVCACALCWCHYLVLLKTNKVMNECRNFKKLDIQIFDCAFKNNFVIAALLPSIRLADSYVILLLQMHFSNYEIASHSFILGFFNQNVFGNQKITLR